MFYIDSREQIYRSVVATIAEREGFKSHEWALEFGDYATEHAIAERKTAQDLLQSSKQGRLFEQLGKGLIDDKAFLLLVTGLCEPVDAIVGLIASVLVRYPDYTVIHETDEVLGLRVMVKWFKKIEQGAQARPHRLPAKVLVAKLLGVSLYTAEELINNYSGLYSLMDTLENNPDRFKQIYGIGDKRLEEMQQRVTHWRVVY